MSRMSHDDPFARRIVTRLASLLIRTLRALTRMIYIRPEIVRDLHHRGQPYVLAFFHDQLLMMTYGYPGRSYGRRIAALTSRHRDGRYIAGTLERFGHLTVGGSTSRGGAAGLKEMVRLIRAGNDLGFAVDGPRGPRHVAQIGAIEASRLGRAPIVPLAFAASKKKPSVRGTGFRSRCRSRAGSLSTASRSSSRPAPIAI
jgi:hypothetical protein